MTLIEKISLIIIVSDIVIAILNILIGIIFKKYINLLIGIVCILFLLLITSCITSNTKTYNKQKVKKSKYYYNFQH